MKLHKKMQIPPMMKPIHMMGREKGKTINRKPKFHICRDWKVTNLNDWMTNLTIAKKTLGMPTLHRTSCSIPSCPT
jgi:hypothetical protein